MIIPYYSQFLKSFDPFLLWWLTVVTILLIAAAAMSSPLGWPTRVMPRYFTLNTIPSKSVSLVSVQFSGSSKTQNKHFHHLKLFKRTVHQNMKTLYYLLTLMLFQTYMTLQGDTDWHPDSLTDSLSLTFCQTSYFVFHRRKKWFTNEMFKALKIIGSKETAWNVNVFDYVID